MPVPSAAPFRIAVADERLAEIRRRLEAFQDLDTIGTDDWDFGVPQRFLRRFVDYWLHEYDWRKVEDRLNALSHYRATVDGVPVHFVHERGRGPRPIPLVLSHGWPWTFYDYVHLIGPLTDPAAHGGDPADAFDVVIPSLPGFAFSTPLTVPDLNFWSTADVWVHLMQDVLGYGRFAAHGGDMGALLTSQLAHRHADQLIGVHTIGALPPMAFNVDRPWSDITGGILEGLGADERPAGLAFERRFAAHTGVQSLAPRTLAYAMSDSPVGLAAWLIEPRYRWSDCGGDVESSFSLDHLTTTVMLYAATGAFPHAVRYYANAWRNQWTPSHDRQPMMEAPAGISWFSFDMPPGSRTELVGSLYNIVYENTHQQGGHFAAVEQPEAVVADIRATFRGLR
jgi:pimeloyl-ACP methyl ester carboxylesterase